MYVCGVYVCTGISVCVYKCVFVYTCRCVTMLVSLPMSQSPSLCMYGYVFSDSDLIVRSEPGNRRPKLDPDSCSQSVVTSGNSKTNTRDDSEIRTGSCSADLMAIQTRNCVISRECLLLHYCYFLLSSV